MAGDYRDGEVNINLHIERLVLDGVNITLIQRRLLQASVTTELTRMLAESGLPTGFTQEAISVRMSTDGIQLTGNNTPTQLGQQIAQSVYGGIAHE